MGLVGCFNVFESLLCLPRLNLFDLNTVKTVNDIVTYLNNCFLFSHYLYEVSCFIHNIVGLLCCVFSCITALIPVGAPSVCGILVLCALLHGISAVISPNCFPECALSIQQVHNNNILDKYFLRFISVHSKCPEKKTISTFSSSPFWVSGRGLLFCGFSIRSFKSSKCCLCVWVVCFLAFCFLILSHTCLSSTVWAACTTKISVNSEESLIQLSGSQIICR